jgi:hypothetical protein
LFILESSSFNKSFSSSSSGEEDEVLQRSRSPPPPAETLRNSSKLSDYIEKGSLEITISIEGKPAAVIANLQSIESDTRNSLVGNFYDPNVVCFRDFFI